MAKKKKSQVKELFDTPLSRGQIGVALVAAALMSLTSSVGLAQIAKHNEIAHNASIDLTAGILNAGKNKDAAAETGSVWSALQAKGLQGEHYTLNIHGKGDTFNKQDCTADPGDGSLGNNVFIPSNGDPSVRNQIIMQSGNAKGKWASTNDIYGVLDTCTAAFDGDAAEVQIPASQKGYYVVARVLGKPTNDPSLDISGDLMWVMDENGNDLLVLGLVTDDGFQTPQTTLTRTKGKTSAVDITGLFEWNGDVCYFDTTNYCYDDAGTYTCSDIERCCTDTDGDGIYETCTDPTFIDGTAYCAVDYSLMTLGCQEYINEWVFNIGDFVGYMWDTFADGDFKLANIRFYPVQ